MSRTDRRKFLKLTGAGSLGLAALVGCSLPRSSTPPTTLPTAEVLATPTSAPAAAAPPPVPDPRSADLALQALIEGNQRYVAQKLAHPNQTTARLTEIAGEQAPFAAVLGCADSRVPPEIVFDRGLGDLFVVRVAGNIADDIAIGSLEFAVAELNIPLIVVLGHERCGAVTATVNGGVATGHIASLVHAIQPAVERSRSQEGDPVENAIVANVQIVVENLKNTGPILAEYVSSGKLKIVGGRYDLDTGLVELVA